MSFSDDPTSPTEKNRARTSQEPRERPQDLSCLSSKETEKSQEPNETSGSSVSPMNRYKEALKNRHGPVSKNQNYDFERSLDSEPIQMMSTSGYVSGSTNNKNNNGQSYLGVEASKNSVGLRTGMQQQMSNRSVIGVDSGTSFTDTARKLQQAYNNLQRLGMPGEGYGTNNPDFFEDQPNFLLGSGGNIASMSSQRDDLRPEKQQKMSNVSNSSISGGVGMYSKTVDSQQGEEHDTNNSDTLGDSSNISLGCFGSIESILKATRDGKEVPTMPTPRPVNNAPQWTIKKRLTKKDVNPYGQLSLPSSSFDQHIRRHLPEEDLPKIVGAGLIVNVFDNDTSTIHKLRLAVYYTYVLTGGWLEDFIQRRSLKERDDIGLLWDSSASRLQFGVIARAKAMVPRKRTSSA
ncbi:B3 domain-containing protein At4g02870 isoform X3 [Arabidopsis lyrata subsp. lyrata]|uniref:B3 domain-containing protein At4g02870 isoform X3 n=1 Tax=Arabidopsis lyrata subsp. lyrata TaxID=81972 RepID=UPI000A29BA2C|nr:B3 domain-containing protein At4g02870 isoform X3 [Arabidopsis lyrata subsp. lyrata]|eukprot:XP_020885694.1 B3 domain-containing protein At4g02870 isoform X3 [Arabidopsis lyrata subsp. lyrata]